jgi:hypothetical protein
MGIEELEQKIDEWSELQKCTLEWVDVTKRLPDTDRVVLWICESGGVFMEHVDKEWDKDYIKYFLKGNRYSGKIVAWANSPSVPVFARSEKNDTN